MHLAKKAPEDTRVAEALRPLGWQLVSGNDVWLIFRSSYSRNKELTFIRKTKEWFFDLRKGTNLEDGAEGVGLDSLLQLLQSSPVTASAATTAVNNAAKDHEEVAGHMPVEMRVATDHQGNPQVNDVEKVLIWLQNQINEGHDPSLDELCATFGFAPQSAFDMIELLKHEGRLPQKQAAMFNFKSKLFHRKNKPVTIFQEQQLPDKEAGPQGEDISQRSSGDFPRFRRATKDQMLYVNGIPANTHYEYEGSVFIKGTSVLQGIDLPLETIEFEPHKIKIEDGEEIGINGRGADASNLSYTS